MLGNEWAESMKSLGQAYRSIYEKDERTPQQRQAAENEYDAYEADPATGGGMDMTFDEWKKQRKKPKKEGVDHSSEQQLAEGYGKTSVPGAKIGGTVKKPNGKTMKVEDTEEAMEIIDEYSVSIEDGISLEEGKKKCKEGYKYDSDKKKCVKKKKKSSSSKKSSKTTIIVGRGYGYGGGHHHHDDDGDKETPTGGSGGGGDAGGDGGGDGGGGGE